MTAAPFTSIAEFDRLGHLLGNPETSSDGVRELAEGLAATRASSAPGEWQEFIQSFRQHPMFEVLQQDPYTSRGYRKPRGYAGDAVLIDFIYGSGEGEALLAKATATGRAIYTAAMRESAIEATRGRRDYLARRIDEACRERLRPHILSVACGHLREAALSAEFRKARAGRFVALDQDRRSLRVVERSVDGVECVAASIVQLMDSSLDPGRFDLIYAAGLYDYLDDATGRELLHALARLVQPGGKVLIANFVPGFPVSGYMEAAMDWWLIYRTPSQLLALADEVPNCVSKRVFCDSHGYLAYLELQFEEGMP